MTYFTARSNLISYAFIWGRLLDRHLMGKKHAANDQSGTRFMFIQKFDLLEEQSDQGLHCLPFASFLMKCPKVWPLCLNLR